MTNSSESEARGEELRTVLIVEDDPGHAELLLRGLGSQLRGHRVVHARDGAEALEVLGLRRGEAPALREPPDLILLDLRLPRMDGFEVLRQIKSSKLARVPVVILTTSENKQDVDRAYRLRANSYLVKPVDFDSLSQMLASLREYWISHNWTYRRRAET